MGIFPVHIEGSSCSKSTVLPTILDCELYKSEDLYTKVLLLNLNFKTDSKLPCNMDQGYISNVPCNFVQNIIITSFKITHNISGSQNQLSGL